MMNLRQRQRGIGWFGLLFVFGMVAFVALVTMRCLPIYLNQMKIAKAVHNVASDLSLASSQEGTEIYKSLQRYWDVDSIDTLKPHDIKITRTDRGRMMSYKYEARAPLFYNISILIEFQDSMSMVAGGGF
jgi:hypothetical protein